MFKRGIALILVAMLLMAMLPVGAMATEEDRCSACHTRVVLVGGKAQYGKMLLGGSINTALEFPNNPPADVDTVEEKVDWIAEQCRNKGITASWDIALWLHDWLVYNANYDYTYSHYTAAGVLLYGTGVCESYSRAYSLLLNEFGIENVQISSPAMNHAWNMVKIDGEWCHVDVTWDDPNEGGYENHCYFGLCDKCMERDHSWDHGNPDYPHASSECNYYPMHKNLGFTDAQGMKDLLSQKAAEKAGAVELFYLGDDPNFSFSAVLGQWYQNAYWDYEITKCWYTMGESAFTVYLTYKDSPAGSVSHSYTTKVTAPTCAAEGYTTYTCSNCGYSYQDDVVPATGKHSYENGFCTTCNAPEPPVADQLQSLISSSASAEEIRNAVQNMDAQKLSQALKENGEAAKDLAVLEQKVGGPAGVKIQDTSLGIAAQDVQIIGANLNNLTGKSATLTISAASKANAVPAGCDAASAIHFSMTLENVTDSGKLAVPVKIVLPVPQNMDASRLVLLHYHGGAVEQIKPVIETINGKKYASVVVEGFSDFAMTQKAHTYSSQYDYKCDYCGAERNVDMTRPMMNMYRMYNPNTGEHFYTGSEVERDTLVDVGWQYEGVGFTFPLTTGKPVHRLFQPSTGEHLYTMDEAEKAKLMAEGWNYEGIAFNSGFENEVPQYRLHNPNATVGAYHFTASQEEKDTLIAAGWEYQGIGWYSMGA